MFAHPAHCIAFGFGSGLSPWAPGTVGTLLAIPLFYLLALVLSVEAILAVAVLFFRIGVWACDRAGRALGVTDHGGMNWDEIVAFLLVLAFCPAALHWQLVAFVLFRLFDIMKPPPIRVIERDLPGGWGVMTDDLMAAFYAAVLVNLCYLALAT